MFGRLFTHFLHVTPVPVVHHLGVGEWREEECPQVDFVGPIV